MLVVIRCLEAFLEGTRSKFEVWTDHKNLEYSKIKSATSTMGSILVQIRLCIEAHFRKQDGKGGWIE